MAELGFQERSSWRRHGLIHRDSSPDSVVFTLESNMSLFSSASPSVEWCSFVSDSHDHHSFASQLSLRLAGCEGDFAYNDNCRGPDPHPYKSALRDNEKRRRFSRNGEKAKVQNEDSDVDIEDESQQFELDSARNSFSLALKECQDRRSRSEALLEKVYALDLNNTAASSPRLGTVRKKSFSSRRPGTATATFPSPGTPNYRVAMQKGWSSERVPLHASSARNNMLYPFSNGRALPSKWEDAERWILSPVSRDGMGKASLPQPQKRPKSKSGPLGPPGIAYYSMYSPAVPMSERGNTENFMAASPFSAGVLSAEGLTIRSGGHGGEVPTTTEPCMARSSSVHGCSEMQSQPSVPAQEDRFDGIKDVVTGVSRAASRRDMATQMSPQGSSGSSSLLRLSFPASTPSTLPLTEFQSVTSPNVDMRDLQIDEHVTLTRWSKKNRSLFSGRASENVESRKVRAQSSAWDISETSKTVSKAKSEEARIDAWENLQKAKAMAAIRKLEMKLEKRRASSMNKIMNKLRLAKNKAQEMRSSVSPNQPDQVMYALASFCNIQTLASSS